MKPHKSTILISLLSLLLSAFVAVSAQQTPAQGDQKKAAESCCASGGSDGCCCSGESCDMTKHENHKMKGEGSCCNMKHKDAKDKTGKDSKDKTAKKV